MERSLNEAIDRLSRLRDNPEAPSWPAVRKTIHQSVQDLEELRADLGRLKSRLDDLEERYRKLKSEMPLLSRIGRFFKG